MSEIVEKKRCDMARLRKDYERMEKWSKQIKCSHCCSTYRIVYADIKYESYYEGGDFTALCPVCSHKEVLWFVPGYVKRCYEITRAEYEATLRAAGLEPGPEY